MTDAARTGALLVTSEDPGGLLVTGPEARSWLNGLLTCDLNALEPGAAVWGLALSKQGKVLSEVSALLLGAGGSEGVLVAVSEGTAEAVTQHLASFLVMEDAELENVSQERAFITLHGPKAYAYAESLCRDDPLLVAARLDVTGLGGAIVALPRSRVEAVAAALVERGAVRASDADWDRLRVERLLPRRGIDYKESDNAHEAGLERRAVSWTKGCYLGQEVVCMQEMRGKVKRRVSGLRIEGTVPPRGARIEKGGKPVGTLTTAAWSERLKGAAGLAMLECGAFAEPASLSVAVGEASTGAVLFSLPV